MAFGGGLVVAPALGEGEAVVHIGVDLQLAGDARGDEQAP